MLDKQIWNDIDLLIKEKENIKRQSILTFPLRVPRFSIGSKLSWDCSVNLDHRGKLFWFSLLTKWTVQSSNLVCYLQCSIWKPSSPILRMVLWPQLALWLNHQIEIISVTWVCGTPAWGFDRWERLLLHLQTRAQGNSHQTSHLGRHTHTHPAI